MAACRTIRLADACARGRSASIDIPQFGVRHLPPMRIVVASPGGGGFGDPRRRDPNAVFAMSATVSSARQERVSVYGVVLTDDSSASTSTRRSAAIAIAEENAMRLRSVRLMRSDVMREHKKSMSQTRQSNAAEHCVHRTKIAATALPARSVSSPTGRRASPSSAIRPRATWSAASAATVSISTAGDFSISIATSRR